MDKKELQTITKLHSKLRRSLEPGSVAAELFSKGVLTEGQYQDILPSLKTTGEKNDFILKCVRKHGRSGIFAIFVQCIEDADPALGYLAEDLRKELRIARQSNTGQEEISGQTMQCPLPSPKLPENDIEPDLEDVDSGSVPLGPRTLPRETPNEAGQSMPDEHSVLYKSVHSNQKHPVIEEGTQECNCEQFMAKYEDQFLEFVAAQEISGKLEIKHVIPPAVHHVIKETDRDDARLVLYRHIRDQGTPPTIKVLCNVMANESGYPKMNSLGRKMQGDRSLDASL
jgi:hypothetical protein